VQEKGCKKLGQQRKEAMTNLNNTEHMRKLIQLVESHENNGLAEAATDNAYTQDQLADIKQQIIGYRKEGWSDKDTSELMGKSRDWVSTMVKRHFRDLLQRTHLALAVTDADKVAMAQEYQKGNITIQQLAKKHDISKDTLKSWLETKLGQEEVARLQALYTTPDRKWTQDEKDWVADQYRQGTGPLAIAAIFMKNIHTQPPGTEEMTRRHVANMLTHLPNYRELQSQYIANQNLRREPEPFTTKIYRAGRIDPEGRKTDWPRGGYK
jgi:lambda repressor-like predicted transcriptional regulator